jgi:ribose transport system permease protein
MNRLGLDRFSGLYLLAAFIVVFSILAPSTFPTATTLHIIASTQSIAGLAALALLIPMVAGHFDLSIGATANLAGVAAAIMQNNGLLGTIPAVLFAVAIGLVIGCINGFIVVRFRINSFITTIAMTSVISAVLIFITGSVEVQQLPPGTFTALTQTQLFGFQTVVIYLLVIAVIVWWALERTPAGRYLHAVGANPEAARLTGIKVDRWSFLSLVASGGLAGLTGVLFVSLTGPALDFGPGLLLPAFAAVFLGSTQLKPGRMNVWGTLIAIFVLAVGVQGLQLVTGITWVAPLFDGVALIIAVGLAVGRERRMSSKGEKPTALPPGETPHDEGLERLDGLEAATRPSQAVTGTPGK